MTDPSRVLILNDTDEGGTHFGCVRVMRTIRTELKLRGLEEHSSIKVGTDWRVVPRFVDMIDAADLVVINGEGTLHHGRRRGRWLLEAGARAKSRGARVALINALWQENPADWADLAMDFDVLACRDSMSADELALATGRNVAVVGDLSMLYPHPVQAAVARDGMTIGCSVSSTVTRVMADLADRMGTEFMPVTTAPRTVPARTEGWRRWVATRVAEWQNRRFRAAHPRMRTVADDYAYLDALRTRQLLVTGRFHSVCMALLTETPFLATSSNSRKIEALVSDIGLDPTRLVTLKDLTPDVILGRDWAFAPQELASIQGSLARWRTTAEALFDSIAELVTPDPPT
jgi:hypothetical protein